MFHFQKINSSKFIESVLKDGKYQSHGTYEVTGIFIAPDSS